jgi:hypothetical protein
VTGSTGAHPCALISGIFRFLSRVEKEIRTVLCRERDARPSPPTLSKCYAIAREKGEDVR